MPAVKKQNIRIKMQHLRSVAGLLLFSFFAGYCSPTASAQVELDFNKWQALQKNYTVFTFAKKQDQMPFYFSSEKRNTVFKSVSDFTVRPLPDVGEHSCLHLTAASRQELGFFCKLDLRMDKTMTMPFRFRLGNLETVNRLEGYWK